MPRIIQASALAAAAILTAAGLSGCTGGQTQIEACANLLTGLTDVTTSLNAAAQTFENDPTGAAQGVATAADSFKGVVDKVTNPEVKQAATTASEKISALSELYDGIAADPTTANGDAITAAGEETRLAMVGLQEACA